MTDGYTFAESDQDIMNLFVKHFQSVYRPASLVNGSQHSTDDNMLMSNVTLYKNEVLSALRSIDCNKGAGPDMLPPMLLAKCTDVLVTPILSLFNKSLTTGIFPEACKRSFITPIFKSGRRNNVLNYRPISIISSIPKSLDCLIADKLSTAVSKLIVLEQHGFRSRKSTLSNLIIYEQFLFDALSTRRQVDSIYTDFSKAFDRVNHAILIDKLKVIGIRGTMLRWFESYLIGRK